MKIEIVIVDGSDELNELQAIVLKNNTEDPQNPITEKQFVSNLIIGYLTNRILNEYKGYAAKQNIETLKNAFGELSNIRSE